MRPNIASMGSDPMDAQVTLAAGRNLKGGGEWGSVCFVEMRALGRCAIERYLQIGGGFVNKESVIITA